MTVDFGFAHRFVPATRPDAPTLLLLHGTGGNEHALLPLGRAVAPGAALLSPRGQVLENGMPRFFRRLAEGVFDVEDLIARTRDLAGFVATATDAYGLDPRRIFAVGYSNGANVAGSLLLLDPGTLRGAALLRAVVPLVPERLPDLAGAPVLLLPGRRDPYAAGGRAEALERLLRESGAAVDLRWMDAGHEIGLPDVAAAREWMGGRP